MPFKMTAFANLTQRQTQSSAKTTTIQRLLELTSLHALTHNHALLCLGFTPGFRHVETSRPLTASGCQEARGKSRQALQTQPGSLRSVVFDSGCAVARLRNLHDLYTNIVKQLLWVLHVH